MKTMCTRAKIVFPVTALLLAAVCGGCGSRPTEDGMDVLRIGYIPIADCSQLYVALEKGFFAEAGIRPELVSLPGGAKILEALGAGSLDVGFSNVISLLLARAAGIPFVSVAGGPAQDAGHRDHAVLVRADSGITSVSDLAGRRIALNTRRNIDDLMVRLLLRKHAVQEDQVTFVEIPFPRMLSVLESGDVDAVAAIEPFVTLGARMSGNRVLTYNYLEIQPVTEISTYVVDRGWLERHRDLAVRLRNVLTRAAEYANEHPEEVRSILTRYTRMDEELAGEIELPYFTRVLSRDRLEEMARHLHGLGWLDRPLSADEAVVDL
jgi:NitT/TauT family transport system substrate-binding protein